MDDIEIIVNTEEILQEAECVSERTKKMEQYFQNISDAVNRSQGYWQGDAAEEHRRMYQNCLGDIQEIVSFFYSNAESLRKIARNYNNEAAEDTRMVEDLPVNFIY